MPAFIDLTGDRFGRLRVVARTTNKGTHAGWSCVCDCGSLADVNGRSLRSGATQSCGCYHREQAAAAKTTHGMSSAPVYAIWSSMLQRCQNENCKDWPDYGGRGIQVCDRWLQFTHFLADMGEPPPGASIERKNNSDNYTPNNCFWASDHQQARNKRNNIMVEWKGRRMILKDAAAQTDLQYKTVLARINVHGWTPERALSEPLFPNR